MRGKEGFIRGLHVGAVVNDDLPDDSSIYSAEQREKLLNIFKGAINPIVEPYGFNLVSGTPYQERDLYYELKNQKADLPSLNTPQYFQMVDCFLQIDSRLKNLWQSVSLWVLWCLLENILLFLLAMILLFSLMKF